MGLARMRFDMKKILILAVSAAALAMAAPMAANASTLGNNIVTSGIVLTAPGNAQNAQINGQVIANNVNGGATSMTAENVEQLGSGVLNQNVGAGVLPLNGGNTGTLGLTETLTTAQNQAAGATVLVQANTLVNTTTSGLAANVGQLGTFTGAQAVN